MSEKKAHEVETLSMLIKHVAEATDMTSIIDLGAGQGYLSRMLALQHGLHVLGVDADEIQTCGAKFFQGKAEKSIKGKKIRALVATEEDPTEAIAKEKERQSHLNHVTQMITLENIPTLLADWTDTSRWNYREVPAKSWMICGLHTCGDLAPTIIRLFQGSPEIGGMISVGCCYHWLTEEKDAQGTYHFPMSTTLIDRGYKLGPTLRMLACQAPGRWETQREATVKSFKHNFYRTMLQKIMVDKGLATIKVAPVVGRMNHKRDFASFPVYVKAALRRFDLSGTITDEEAIEFEAKARQDGQYRKMIILWTLRIMLSPIIESIILVDRWVYLKDTLPNAKICMWPLFDKVASPRNVVIAALKEGTNPIH
ncbi:methyltransferase domain-containing protein [Umbelopsis sp. AD052]|nr:methyltransferase domain-containing protein [Umbelopsis sp. AD052]